ncbi:zinc-ribbon domain-containing protein [Agromyces sp. MMS24-JH15]|uniref:zinc-ribbon domain-containing protein n=1 Tax=Agromyces sp. MMS24-JH15 TaxID=3243765 RepID=UPI0037497D14
MRCTTCDADLPDGAMFCGECGSSTTASRRAAAADVPPEPVAPLFAHSAEFTLTFSTGEVRRVSGRGLIGRRPIPEPGESFDHLVQIADRTLSVSKTHVEFGELEGDLWVSDRYSGNGTIVDRPDAAPLRCEPGRRYVVPRGSWVRVAEQSFRVE